MLTSSRRQNKWARMTTASFESWIFTDVPPTDEHAADVAAARAFVAEEATPEAAAALSGASLPAVEALVAGLTERLDGSRLALLKQAGMSKKARKVVGKAIHKLKTRGIECEAPTGRVGSLSYVKESLASWMSIPDGLGVRFMLLAGRTPNEQLECCYALGGGGEGVIDFVMIEEPSKSRLKRIMGDIESERDGFQARFVEVPADLARTRLNESAAVQRSNNKPLPNEFADAHDLLAGDTVDRSTHPARALVGPSDAALIENSALLLTRDDDDGKRILGEADRPLLSQEQGDGLHGRLEAIVHDDANKEDEDRKRALVLEELDTFALEIFTPTFTALQADRLLDCAYCLHKIGKAGDAKIALATADALMVEGASLLEIPWVKESFRGMFDVEHLLNHTHEPDHEHGRGEAGADGEHVHDENCDH
ncbi:MAG: hypothetical protein ACI9OJ_005585 [Myxococcota bacterium]|jgi:hypothetical protein